MARIALLGFGNVGRAFARHLTTGDAAGGGEHRICAVADISGGLLLEEAGLDITRVLEKLEHGGLLSDCAESGGMLPVDDYLNALPAAGIRVLVECLPTNPVDGEPALTFLRRSLEQNVAAVTVNKGPIVYGHRTLTEAAARSGARLAYSGTTGVRPPVEIAGCHILDIRGILNGTTNFILTEIQRRDLAFRQALDQAKEQGIAEPNPDLDIQGWDTACKILILANEWMAAGALLSDVVRIGIGPETEALLHEARAKNGVVRLIGRARRSDEGICLSVTPKICLQDSVFHSIEGTSKGAIFRTREKGEIFAGGVSGREAIAKVILQDVEAVLTPRDSRPGA